MKIYLYHILRISLGLPMAIFGVNKWYIFIPIKLQTAAGQQFIDSLYASGYLMLAVGAVQFTSGVLLLSNRLVSLALIILLPISVNIFLFNLFLNPIGIAVGTAVFVSHVILIYFKRINYMGLLKD